MKYRIIAGIIIILFAGVAWFAIKSLDKEPIPSVRVDDTKDYVKPFNYDTNFDGKG